MERAAAMTTSPPSRDCAASSTWRPSATVLRIRSATGRNRDAAALPKLPKVATARNASIWGRSTMIETFYGGDRENQFPLYGRSPYNARHKPASQGRRSAAGSREILMRARDGVEIRGPLRGRAGEVLTDEAVGFVGLLHREFAPARERLLARRAERWARIRDGEVPDFLPGTRAIREGSWTVAPVPPDLRDRRVEITGPVD